MPKLKLHEKWLYHRKQYDALSKRMRRTEEGAARFNELCCQDVCLQVWLVQNIHSVRHAITGLR